MKLKRNAKTAADRMTTLEARLSRFAAEAHAARQRADNLEADARRARVDALLEGNDPPELGQDREVEALRERAADLDAAREQLEAQRPELEKGL